MLPVKIKALQTNHLKFWHALGFLDKGSLKKNKFSLINLTIMNLFLFHSPEKKPEQHIVSHLLVPNFEPPHHTNEDSEFPAPVIRLAEQPLIYTEGCIAAGCPEDLW